MPKSTIQPFKNEEDSLLIGDLTVENRLDRISIYGSLDITLDKTGLKAAQKLKAILDDAIAVMEKADLPDQITISKPEIIRNPFL